MENQHQKIKGYRDLNKTEIDLINAIKTQGEMLQHLIDELRLHKEALDQRWVSIGQTDLQTGISALVRSVAKPESF